MVTVAVIIAIVDRTMHSFVIYICILTRGYNSQRALFCILLFTSSSMVHALSNFDNKYFSLQDVAFVIDGWALEIALKHYWKAFTELAILSRTAICCRVTPSQKAQVIFGKFQ